MQNVYTVRQVNAYIKSMFTQDVVLRSIYMKGEVSNCKYHTSGHIYFSLKDETGTLSCVMFAGHRRGLAFRMKDGDKVVVGGAVPKNYFPAVEKGLQECVLKGPLAGYPVVGLKATLLDGSYHPVDSSEMAFKMATILAFKQGFMDANPVLLEPIASLKVVAPDRFTGDIMGDLNRRRGRVLGMESDHHGKQVIEADIPMSELFGYNTDLRSMTGGLGDYSYEFSRYEQAPGDVQKREVEARAAAKEE